MATKPTGVRWAKRGEGNYGGYDRQFQGKQAQRPGQGRKTGDCYFCGKPGHFAQECRSRLYKDRLAQPTQPGATPPMDIVKKEPAATPQKTRNLADVTCFRCRQKGHISPDCPKRTGRVKRIKIPEEKCVRLRRNEVFGSIGSHRLPITCDTGAEVTVIPEECVEPHQKTGELCELKAFNKAKTTGEWCSVSIKVGEKTFHKRAVTQPGEALGWSACLSLDMADPAEANFLVEKMKERAAMTREQTLYLPPEVRDGELLSGISATDAVIVHAKKECDPMPKEGIQEVKQSTAVPVRSTEVEAPVSDEVVGTDMEKKVDEREEAGKVLENELSLELVEAEGEALGGSAPVEGVKEMDVTAIREGMPRAALAAESKVDQSLQPLYRLGQLDKEGYHLEEGVLFRTRLNSLGSLIEQLCVPMSHRHQCLQAAHSNFRH